MPSTVLPPSLRAAPIAVVSTDLTGRLVDANPALLAACGFSIDELRGRALDSLFGGADPAEPIPFASLASGAIESYRGRRRCRSRAGALVDMDVSVSALRSVAGEPEGCVAFLQDVTAYQNAVRDAARRAAELEAVIQSIPAAVFVGDATGIQVANRSALDQLGFDSLPELHRSVVAISAAVQVRRLSGEAVPVDDVPFARALRGERVDEELRIRHLRTGGDTVQRVIAGPIVFEGNQVGAAAVSVDITAQREMEEALRQSEERYRALVEQAPLSIQILAPSGFTLQVNNAWQRLWGIRVEQLAAYNMLEDRQLVECGVMPYIRRAFAGEAVQIPPVLYDPDATLPGQSSHDDPRRWVRAVMYPLKGPDGAVRQVVLIQEDMTEQVRAEEQRGVVARERERLLAEARMAHQRAEAASRVKDEFLAVLSHELRTPLNAVLGWAKILRTREVGDQIEHAVTVIERNAAEQARLIDDLLDLSRITAGKIRLNVEPVDAAAVVRDALESVRPAADARRIQLELRIAGPLPPVRADPQRLQQVLWNLLSNAVKFNETGGRVLVVLSATADDLEVEVTNTGVGISPEVLPFIFDRFTQGDSSSTRAHSGLGLGLAIVRHLIELHGGTLEAASGGHGTGATFRFTIPLR